MDESCHASYFSREVEQVQHVTFSTRQFGPGYLLADHEKVKNLSVHLGRVIALNSAPHAELCSAGLDRIKSQSHCHD